MADISVEVCGLKFRNPVLPAAGPPGRDGKRLVRCLEGGAGGLVTKTISTTAAQVPMPHMAAIRGGFLNTELWSELPPERWLEREYPIAREAADRAGVPLIISLGYSGQEVAQLARKVRPWADALELSTHYLGEDPRPMIEAIAAAKDNVDVPVFVKMSPLGREMRAAAQAAEEAGAGAIVATNSFGPCFGVDVETGYPLLGGDQGYGWLSGPAIKPLALRCVFDIARTVNLPLIGVGGISSGADALEFIMAGARAVQVCTAAILRGPSIYGKIAQQMERWLDEHGYGSVGEIRGLAIRRWQELQPYTFTVPVLYNEEECTGCGLCELSCHYDAIWLEGDVAVFDPHRCFGCGLCAVRCPTHALLMPRVEVGGQIVNPLTRQPIER